MYSVEVKRDINTINSSFGIVEVISIQSKDDKNNNLRKIADFTSETIYRLTQEGFQDTVNK
jgi:hypothetical protein